MNNTNLKLTPQMVEKIRLHYEHAVKKHPYFCDMLYWMGRDAKADAEIAKQREEQLAMSRRTLAEHVRTQHVTSLNVLDCELKELWAGMVDAHIAEKECRQLPDDTEEVAHNKEMAVNEAWAQTCDEAYDCIAVLLRIVDVIHGRQGLGPIGRNEAKER